jgi:16S rRNA processing protein RimM
MAEQVIVGTIGRAHGLRGQVTVRPRTDDVEQRFAPGATVMTGDRALTVSGHSWQQGRLVVGFAGISDRTGAEALRGLDLWADGPAEPADDDEFHDTALIGLAAVDPDGERLGDVVGVQHNPAQDLLVVRTQAGERLVPFVAELVPHVDPDAGHVVIDPIPGLLDEVPDED